jgi:hypothetical protein
MTASDKGVTVVEVMLLIAVVLICAAVFTPMLSRPTNCGGNTAALSACRYVAVSLKMIAMDRGDAPLSITNLTPREKETFKRIPGASWLPGCRILVARGPIEEKGKEIIAVCEQPFRNVPRRIIGKAPPTHAVGYSDGSAGLISVEQFRRADFSAFIDVKTITQESLEPDASANRSQPFTQSTNLTSTPAGSGR